MVNRLLDPEVVSQIESWEGYVWISVDGTAAQKLVRPEGGAILYGVKDIGAVVLNLKANELAKLGGGRITISGDQSYELSRSDVARSLTSDESNYSRIILGHENIIEARDGIGDLVAVTFGDVSTMLRPANSLDISEHIRVKREQMGYASKKVREVLESRLGDGSYVGTPTEIRGNLNYVKGPILRKHA